MSGPFPVYQPCFSEEFVAEARRLANARIAPTHLRQRAQLVLLLHEHPAISNVVRRWRQRWSNGNFTLQDAKGRGRKPTFSPSG